MYSMGKPVENPMYAPEPFVLDLPGAPSGVPEWLDVVDVAFVAGGTVLLVMGPPALGWVVGVIVVAEGAITRRVRATAHRRAWAQWTSAFHDRRRAQAVVLASMCADDAARLGRQEGHRILGLAHRLPRVPSGEAAGVEGHGPCLVEWIAQRLAPVSPSFADGLRTAIAIHSVALEDVDG